MLKAVRRDGGNTWVEIADLDTISDLRAGAGALLWAEADVKDITADDIATIEREFELDHLATEDAVHTRQRPKLESYENHLFTVLHQLDETDGQLEARQIACFIGSNYVLTIHEGADRLLEEAKRRWAEREVPEQNAAFLVHTLLDAVVDDYGAIADHLEDEVEDLEDAVLEVPLHLDQRQLYSVKQRVARLRRYVVPANRILDPIINTEHHPLVSRETAAFFRDVDDHLQRIHDQIENIDRLAQAVLDLHRSEQANSLNETTKRLTGWAAIIAVPTLIASVFGMNYSLFPPAEWGRAAFGAILAAMTTTGLLLYRYFKAHDWI